MAVAIEYKRPGVPTIVGGIERAARPGAAATASGLQWKPRGAGAWTLTCVGCALALLALVTLYYMLHPVAFDGAGRLGFLAMLLAPQLLVATLLSVLLGRRAWRRRAVFAILAFALVVPLTALMAFWPSLAEFEQARQYDVPVSIAAALIPRLNRGGPDTERTIVYGTAEDGSKLLLDAWPAPTVPPPHHRRPVIIKIHGGGWTHGSRGELKDWNRLFNRLGYDVFDIDYRMPPTASWRSEVGDVKCAIGWVVANASRYRIDTRRITLMGDSAGANLALLAAYSMGDPNLPPSCHPTQVKIRSVINIYGPTDMAQLYRTSGSPSFVPPMMEDYIGGPPAAFPDRYRMLSPVSYVNADAVPTLTVQGEADRVVPAEQALILDKALGDAGVYHETYLIAWGDHGFDANWGSFATQMARAKVKLFLEHHG
jgi:acetyl esterase/lipase